MKRFEVKVPKGTQIAVVGDIHEHIDHFNKVIDRVKPSEKMIFVSVGDVYDKGFGIPAAESITDILRNFAMRGQACVVRGNHELKHIRRAQKENKPLSSQLAWWDSQPIVISFVFSNNTKLTVVHGGVTPSHTSDDLGADIEVCYVRDLDEKGQMIKLRWVEEDGKKTIKPEKPGGVSWHEKYDGRFGYIAAGHQPQKDGKAKFYNYSCNLDSACYATGVLSCQLFNEKGLGEFFTIDGPCKKWIGD